MEARGILKFLNVRDNESKLVVDLSVHYFAQSVGIAIFFTICSSQFLSQFDISYLPFVLLGGGISQILISRIYSYFEHHGNLNLLMPRVVLALGVISVGTFVITYLTDFSYGYIVAYILFYILYLLNSLEFWGVSALSFDVRQSKRLFGIISTGDIPAKLLGYMMVPILVKVFSMSYLYLMAAMAFVFSFYSLRKLLKHTALYVERTHAAKTARGLEQEKFTTKYIRQIAVLSGVAVFVIALINYSFLSEVQVTYKSDEELAMFLGTFFSFGKVITIVYKIFFSGKATEKFGIKKNLMIFPLSLLVMSVLIAIFFVLEVNKLYVLYSIGIMMLIVEVVKKAVHEPVFLALFQPLNRHDRLKGHSVVKGFTDPIFLLLAAGLLLFLVGNNAHVDLELLNFVLLVTLVIWVVVIVLINRSYFNNLLSAFEKRISGLQHLHLTSKVLKKQVDAKIKGENIDEISFIYSLLSREAKVTTLETLLDTGKTSLMIFALSEYRKLTEEEQVPLDKIEQFTSHENEDLKRFSFEVFATFCESPEFLIPQLEKSTPELKSAIITGLLKRNSIEHITTGGEFLFKMLGDSKTKVEALNIVGDIGNDSFYRPILKAFNDEDDKVVRSAIRVSSKINNSKLVPSLVNFLHSQKHGRTAVGALTKYENEAIEKIASNIVEYSLPEGIIRRCISLCGKIETLESRQALLKALHIPSQTLYMQLLDSLMKINYKVNKEGKQDVLDKIDQEIDLTLYIIQSMFVLDESKKFKNTVHALNLELNLIQARIFYLLSFIYPTASVVKAREGLLINNNHIQSNALEALEMTIRDLAFKGEVIALMDPHLPLDQKMKRLEQRNHQIHMANNTIMDKILYSQTQEFNKWTIASVLYDLKINDQKAEQPQTVHLAHHSLIDQIINPMENQGHLINFDKIILLRTTDIFSETPENILLDLADIMEEVEVNAGDVIFEKGMPGYDMYIIHKGTVDIKDRDTVLATLNEKDFFGELALLDPEPRSATALAKTDAVLFKLDQEAFYEIMSDRVEVAKGIMKVLCRRLRRQNDKVSDNG